MLKRKLTFVICAGLVGVSSFSKACEFHSSPMFGAFSANHPMMEAYKQRRLETSKLTLTHEKTRTVKVNQEDVLEIGFQRPFNFRNVTLQFTSSDGIVLKQLDKIAVRQLNGSIELNYEAKSLGEHEIQITAEATRNGKPFSQVQQIKLTAI